MQKFRSMWLPYTEGIKDGGQQYQKAIWALLLSLLTLLTTFQQQLAVLYKFVTPNIIVGLYCCDYPLSYLRLSTLSLGLGSS